MVASMVSNGCYGHDPNPLEKTNRVKRCQDWEFGRQSGFFCKLSAGFDFYIFIKISVGKWPDMMPLAYIIELNFKSGLSWPIIDTVLGSLSIMLATVFNLFTFSEIFCYTHFLTIDLFRCCM
jgi:hypothetical protein